MMPVTSFVAATERLGSKRARSLIRDNEAVADTNWVVDYFRRTEDDRLLVRRPRGLFEIEPPNLAGQHEVAACCESSRNWRMSRIEYAWGGYIAHHLQPAARHGTARQVTYYAHGYSGQGVALANLYGKLMAEVIRGQSERFDLLARFRHLPFPGGSFRLPILVAAMAWYRLRDALA